MHTGATEHLPGTIPPMLGDAVGEEVRSLASPAPSCCGSMSGGLWLGGSFP